MRLGTTEYQLDDGTVLTLHLENVSSTVLPDADESEWNAICKSDDARLKIVDQVRYLVKKHPNLKRALVLYLMYVVGQSLSVYLVPDKFKTDDEDTEEDRIKVERVKFESEKAWRRFLEANKGSWSVAEFYRRLLRDGEQFTYRVKDDWPVQVRFIEPEDIDDGSGDAGNKGIVTKDDDVTVPERYLVYDHEQGKVIDELDAEEVYHSKCDVDSNEKRGRSRFESVIDTAVMLSAMVRNEVGHRNAQSSIILIRKVAGTRSDASTVVDNARTGTSTRTDGSSIAREKFRAGTILTVSKNVDIEFAQPQSNFSDASPLVRLLLQQISAATGFSYSQLTADAGEGNFASALVAESPVYQMIEFERGILQAELHRLIVDVFSSAIAAEKLTGITVEEMGEDWKPVIKFQDIVSRDIVKEAQAANLGVMQQALSRMEMGRRLKADPEQMQREIERELQQQIDRMGQAGTNLAPQNTIPDPAAMKDSSTANASAGGTNQGDGAPVEHSDKVGV